MKKQGEGKTKAGMFSGKGFYVALAVSVAAIGAAAWLGVNTAMDKLKSPEPLPQEIKNEVKTPVLDDTVKNQQTASPKNDVIKDEKKSEAVKGEEKQSTAVTQGYILPIKGNIINPYSGDKVVKSKTLDDWIMHTGVDIKAAISTPVKAISGGTVKAIENDDLWGTTVTIDHGNGISSYYANLKSAVNVKKNQAVKLGDVIGAVGDTCDIERADGEHLHFGMKKGGSWIDPFSLIN